MYFYFIYLFIYLFIYFLGIKRESKCMIEAEQNPFLEVKRESKLFVGVNEVSETGCRSQARV